MVPFSNGVRSRTVAAKSPGTSPPAVPMNDGNPNFGSIHFVKLTSTGARLVACTCAPAASVTLEGAVGAVGPPA